jgi:hypothetical protein
MTRSQGLKGRSKRDEMKEDQLSVAPTRVATHKAYREAERRDEPWSGLSSILSRSRA